MNRPNTCANLIKALNRLAAPDRDALRLGRALANVIVAQMMPDGVVKGGSSLMFRYGGDATRYTRDMDLARVMSLDDYLDQFEARLATGWNGFTGTDASMHRPWRLPWRSRCRMRPIPCPTWPGIWSSSSPAGRKRTPASTFPCSGRWRMRPRAGRTNWP